MVRLVIDTDPGVDDAHAIMMALAHPQVKLEALTTVSGNVPVALTTANALKILEQLGREDVPVYAGAARALIARHPHADDVHGRDGLGESGYPLSRRRLPAEHAANALVRLANENPGELTLAAIGPLTNLALAVSLDPDLPGKFKRLVVMGGAIRAGGNTTPVAEFNTYADPEAAAIVLEAWPMLELVSWETTLAHCFSAAQVDELLGYATPRGEFFRRISAQTLAFIERVIGVRMLFAADFLAVAAAVEPEVVLKAEAHHVDVELGGQIARGLTAVDWRNVTGKPANARVALEMDMARLWELFKMAVR